MSIYHGKDARLYVAGYGVGPCTTVATPKGKVDWVPYSVMDGSSGYHFAKGGINSGCDIRGVFDQTYQQSLEDLLLAASGSQFLIVFNQSVGDNALGLQAVREANFTIESTIKQLVSLNAELLGDDCYYEILKALQPETSVTADGQSTALDNSASSANGGVGYLHYFGLGADDTCDIVIEESSDNGSTDPWATKLAFTQIDGSVATRGSERKTCSGTVERYLRVKRTFGGSSPYACTFVVAFKRS